VYNTIGVMMMSCLVEFATDKTRMDMYIRINVSLRVYNTMSVVVMTRPVETLRDVNVDRRSAFQLGSPSDISITRRHGRDSVDGHDGDSECEQN
jgi:hypothetical protein